MGNANCLRAVRLNRYLASCGLGSRRGCESLILEGRVTIGSDICVDLAHKVTDGEAVKVDGKPARPAPAQTIAIFKPRGMITTRNDELERPTVYGLLPDHLQDLSHIGRLDQESEGLLILTRDGDLSYALTHPSSEIEKEYLVTVDQAFDRKHIERLLRGIHLEDGKAKAKSCQLLSPRRIQIILTQGMKRQIRLMLEALGYRVRKLVRVRIGQLTLDQLTTGRWRPIPENELSSLRSNPQQDGPAEHPKQASSEDPVKKKQIDRDSAKRRAKAKRMAADRQWKRNQSPGRRSPSSGSRGRGRGGGGRGRTRGGRRGSGPRK